MKTLIIYYSLDGNVKLLSETMAAEIGADLLPLKLKKEINSNSFMKYFWGGRQVIMKEAPELLPLDKNINNYDLIIIGTPVWAASYVPAIRSLLLNNQLINKKIALFCSHESNPGKTFKNLEGLLNSNQVIATGDFYAPLKKEKEASLDRARAWVKDLV